jgi:hypothetical protein
MKGYWIIGFALVLLSSCGTKNAVKQTEQIVKGDWTLSTVTYEGVGEFKSTLLQDVTASCFEGSSWVFIANNNRGVYTIKDSSCNAGERKFIWTVPGDKNITQGDILLKITDDNYKSESNAGYRLEVTSLSENNMTWSLPSTVNGKTVYVNMNFIKNQNK